MGVLYTETEVAGCELSLCQEHLQRKAPFCCSIFSCGGGLSPDAWFLCRIWCGWNGSRVEWVSCLLLLCRAQVKVRFARLLLEEFFLMTPCFGSNRRPVCFLLCVAVVFGWLTRQPPVSWSESKNETLDTRCRWAGNATTFGYFCTILRII